MAQGNLVRLGADCLAWGPLRPLAARWERFSRGLALPPETPAYRAGLAIALAGGSLFVLGVLGSAWTPGLLTALLLGALPLLQIERAWVARGRALERDLPWILDFLTMGVQAGMDFEVALDRAARAKPGALAAEIQELLSNIRMGVQRRQALGDWAERCQVASIKALSGALVQADTMGSGLSQVLKAQSDAIRARHFQRAEALAQQAPVKMLMPLVVCFFPLTFIILFGPIFSTLSW